MTWRIQHDHPTAIGVTIVDEAGELVAECASMEVARRIVGAEGIVAAFGIAEPVKLIAGKYADEDVRSCYYCEGPEDYPNFDPYIRHTHDCPWMLAAARTDAALTERPSAEGRAG